MAIGGSGWATTGGRTTLLPSGTVCSSSTGAQRHSIGEDSSSLLGALLVTTIGLASFSRAEVQAERRRDFFVYVDEFQSFTTLAMANMFSELRKYRVGFTVAHQYLHQLEPEVRHAVLGNVGTTISFRVGLRCPQSAHLEIVCARWLVRLLLYSKRGPARRPVCSRTRCIEASTSALRFSCLLRNRVHVCYEYAPKDEAGLAQR